MSWLISVLLIYQQVCATLFTRQILCGKEKTSQSRCREVLTGLLHLNSQESVEFETFTLRDLTNGTSSDSTDDTIVSLRIEKSPLLVVYDLEYATEVAGGISEDIYEYMWSTAAGFSSFLEDDFEPNRCLGVENEVAPLSEIESGSQDLQQLFKGGRVCGCMETGWGSSSYSNYKRSKLNCNAWPAVFRPGSTTWSSRHCPRVVPPSFSVFKLRNWRWEFKVEVSLEWEQADSVVGVAESIRGPKMSKTFHLDWNTPHAYDQEFDFGFRILFSVSQSGATPPDLSQNHFLLQPNLQIGKEADFLNALSLPTNLTNSTTLLVPSSHVDLTGKSCNKIGTSLFTWAREEKERNHTWIGTDDFCSEAAGECSRNQPNDLLVEQYIRIQNGKTPEMLLDFLQLPGWSSEAPFLMPSAQKPTALAWPTSMNHQTSLEVYLNATEIAWMSNLGRGKIERVIVTPIRQTSVTRVTATVTNLDAFDARFSVGVPNCTSAALLEERNTRVRKARRRLEGVEKSSLSVAPVTKTLAASEEGVFDLLIERFNATESLTYECELRLQDARGRILDHVPLDVVFLADEKSSVSMEQPTFSEANVSSTILLDPKDPSTWMMFSNQQRWSNRSRVEGPAFWRSLFGIGHSGSGSGGGECPCSIGSFVCIMAHFGGCTVTLRRAFVGFLILVVSIFSCISCSPKIVQLSLLCLGFTRRFAKRRLRRAGEVMKRGASSSTSIKGGGPSSTVSPKCGGDSTNSTVGSRQNHVASFPSVPIQNDEAAERERRRKLKKKAQRKRRGRQLNRNATRYLCWSPPRRRHSHRSASDMADDDLSLPRPPPKLEFVSFKLPPPTTAVVQKFSKNASAGQG